MKTFTVGFCLATTLPAFAATDMAGTLSYAYRMVSTEGVTKQGSFQERFVRSADNIWTERIIPANASTERHDEPGDKHDHSLATAGKLITRDAQGNLRLAFVRTREKAIYTTLSSNYNTVGFDGSWEGNWSLVNPAQFKKMTQSKRAAAPGAVWYEIQTKGAFERVLWHQQNQIALVIESGTDNGNRYSKTTFTPSAFPSKAALPWNKLAGYAKRDYDDLLD
ncbi:hypothetical protein [Chitinimonas sp. BJB300]|uniref:hypothetical protein n=1 Tax=Chitinimonas sp. BJB300 TaxID=1559339 RepID=UPI000C11BA8B|nr:hypothetical protein [Chitinimonas sp. BJB300]PHV12071.1 hypothetical protein CSQ89_07600 [Chitinimonas sp. BJB300]TSJ87324.1 hypothetical protein FG002_013855 [Chitinimonas sp. BJB300]